MKIKEYGFWVYQEFKNIKEIYYQGVWIGEVWYSPKRKTWNVWVKHKQKYTKFLTHEPTDQELEAIYLGALLED